MHEFEQYPIGITMNDSIHRRMRVVPDRIGALAGLRRQFIRVRDILPRDRIVGIGGIDQRSHLRRDRDRVTRELRAATAETRVSALLIGALPVIAFVLMSALNPRYATFFMPDPTGHRLLAVAGGLQVLGVVAIRRLLRLDY